MDRISHAQILAARHPFSKVTEEIARTMSRENLIDWLEWSDHNGTYNDIDSLNEYGNVLNKEDALEIVIRQLAG